jgi:hypothetical protein
MQNNAFDAIFISAQKETSIFIVKLRQAGTKITHQLGVTCEQAVLL